MVPTDVRPPSISLTGLFAKFLSFGLLAFGGPVAQIAMLREALVEREGWVSPARFNRLLAVMQILPGSEAHELAVHLGIVARGRLGGLLAGLGFMLPGFVLMVAAAALYVRFAGALAGSPVLLGVQIVVVAIIVRAVQRIGSHVLDDPALWVAALLAFALTLLKPPFWLPLIAGGLGYSLTRGWPVLAVIALVAVAAVAFLRGDDAGLALSAAAATATSAPTLLALFVAGLKGGLLTFGGAYTAIPYVRTDTVGRGWLSDATFLDGVAIGGLLPAPLVIFATFVGFVAGGLPGAVMITLGMFLPAFAFSLLFFERLEAVVENAALHHVLAGVAAAVVGIIAATCVQLGWTVAGGVSRPLVAGALFIAALAAAWRLKGGWVAPVIVAGGAIAGALLRP